MKGYAQKSALFGNANHGNAFDDNEATAEMGLPTEISVRRGAIIDKVTFIYGQKKMEHGGNGGSEQVFKLEEGERIVSVEGTIGKFGNVDTIRSLKFTTDKNHIFVVNQPVVIPKPGFKFEVEDGYAISALHGRADRYLRAIGFYALNLKKQDEMQKRIQEKTQDKTGDLLSGIMPGK